MSIFKKSITILLVMGIAISCFTGFAVTAEDAYTKYTSDFAEGLVHMAVENAQSSDPDYGNYYYVGQEVVPAESNISGINLNFKLNGSGTIHVELREQINSGVLGTVEQDISGDGNFFWHSISFNTNITVTPGTRYYFVWWLTKRSAGSCIVVGKNVGYVPTHGGYLSHMSDGGTSTSLSKNNILLPFEIITKSVEPYYFNGFNDLGLCSPKVHLALNGADSGDADYDNYWYMGNEFIPNNNSIKCADIALDLSADSAVLHTEIRSELNGSAIGSADTTIYGSAETGLAWYRVEFGQNVSVKKGGKYYLVWYLKSRSDGACIQYGADSSEVSSECFGVMCRLATGGNPTKLAKTTSLAFPFMVYTEYYETKQEPFTSYTNDFSNELFHLALNGATSSDPDYTNYYYLAQEFVPSQSKLKGIKLNYKINCNGVLHTEIRKTLNGEALISKDTQITGDNGYTWYDVVFDSALEVTPGYSYYYVCWMTSRDSNGYCIVSGKILGSGEEKAVHPGAISRMSTGGNANSLALKTDRIFPFELEEIKGGEPTKDPLLGDVDANSQINTVDALYALRNAAGKITLDTVQTWCADVNFDKAVTAADALEILRYAIELISKFTGDVPENIPPKTHPETVYNTKASVLPCAAATATKLLVSPLPAEYYNRLTVSALQGMTANLSNDQIVYGAGKAYNKYIQYVTDPALTDTPVTLSYTNEKGEAWATSALIEHYAYLFDGYILCDSNENADSGKIAVSIAKQFKAMVVTPQNECYCKINGMKCLINLCGKNDNWFRNSEYFDKINKNVAVEQPITWAPRLVDYAAMTGCYINFYTGLSKDGHQNMFEFLNDNATVLGWNDDFVGGNGQGEYGMITTFAHLNAQMIPANHCWNISTFSGFELDKTKYNPNVTQQVTQNAHHTVCICMSDGDNLAYLLDNYDEPSWYGSQYRGRFGMTWGVPTASTTFSAPMLSYLFNNATPRDEFMLQISGLGYTYPGQWTSAPARQLMAQQVVQYAKDSGIKYFGILDDRGLSNINLDWYTQNDTIEGIAYLDYSRYDNYGGQVLWSNGTPIVSARYMIWNGLTDINSIANSINSASTNINSLDSYSLVAVHAWSGLDGNGNLVPNGDTMAACNLLAQKLGANVDTVTISEFFRRIKTNIAH